MPERVYPRRTTQPKRRQTNLDQSKGANPDDAPGTDINKIVAQYRRNGTMPAVAQLRPLYGDFTGPADLHNAQIQIQLAEDRFRELPADIRTAADNDPVRFLEMFENPDQRALLESAGLIISPPTPLPENPTLGSPTTTTTPTGSTPLTPPNAPASTPPDTNTPAT